MPDFMWTTASELAIKVQMEPWPRSSPPFHHGGWELVYNEAAERCSGRGYDPCALFKGRTPAEIAAAWPYEAPEWPRPGAPFYVHTQRDWYGKNKEDILNRTVGAGLTFRGDR